MVAQARDRFPDIGFEVGDLTRLLRPPTAPGWGAVVAWYSLVHLAGSELPDAVGALARVLDDDGWLALALHVGEEVRRVETLCGEAVSMDFVLHDREQVLAAVRAAGLVDVEWYQRGPYDVEALDRAALRPRPAARPGLTRPGEARTPGATLASPVNEVIATFTRLASPVNEVIGTFTRPTTRGSGLGREVVAGDHRQRGRVDAEHRGLVGLERQHVGQVAVDGLGERDVVLALLGEEPAVLQHLVEDLGRLELRPQFAGTARTTGSKNSAATGGPRSPRLVLLVGAAR